MGKHTPGAGFTTPLCTLVSLVGLSRRDGGGVCRVAGGKTYVLFKYFTLGYALKYAANPPERNERRDAQHVSLKKSWLPLIHLRSNRPWNAVNKQTTRSHTHLRLLIRQRHWLESGTIGISSDLGWQTDSSPSFCSQSANKRHGEEIYINNNNKISSIIS